MRQLSKSPFSYHFNVLTIMGFWLLESNNPKFVKIFSTYRMIIMSGGLYGALALLVDLYFVFGDISKMTWNICVSFMFIGSFSKHFQLMKKKVAINNLRMKLHMAEELRNSPEDIIIHNIALKELKFLRVIFYGAVVVFVPIWLVTRYVRSLWGTKEYPAPLRLPIKIDVEDIVQFTCAYILIGALGTTAIVMVVEQELCMFALLIQITREYKVLLKDITNLNKVYEYSNVEFKNTENIKLKTEINPWLRKRKVKSLVKQFIVQQQKIIEYTEEFESCYTIPMFYQFLNVSILVTANAFQCLMESIDFTGNIFYQFGYLIMILVDMFLICWFSTRLHYQCVEVGEATYSTLWYKMGVDIRRDIAFIIMRSQRPPKITSGKFVEMSLNTFQRRMSHIYSWLALFRQLM